MSVAWKVRQKQVKKDVKSQRRVLLKPQGNLSMSYIEGDRVPRWGSGSVVFGDLWDSGEALSS